MTVKEADECRQSYVSLMGEQVGAAFYALLSEVVLLFEKWGDYESLYGVDQKTVELLNSVAPVFFGRHQRIAESDIIIHLARLLDPAASCGRSNLSLRGFAGLVRDAELSQKLSVSLDELEKLTGFVANRRNLVLAHRDREHAMGLPGARQLESVSRAKIKSAMAGVGKVLNVVASHYDQPYLAFEISYFDDAEDLLVVLREYVDLESIRSPKC